MGIESPVHLLFIAVVALVVLGPKRLPDLAKALGQGIREFRQSLDEGASAAPAPPPAASIVSAPAASSATPAPAPAGGDETTATTPAAPAPGASSPPLASAAGEQPHEHAGE